MQYPIAIEWGDDLTATGVIIPDIPGAITAGDTVEEAFLAAVEVAQIQLEELAMQGKPIPMPSSIDDLRKSDYFKGWGWGVIEIDITPYLGKTEKVNVTLPSSIIHEIDRFVEKHGLKSRSAFLADAAREKLAGAGRLYGAVGEPKPTPRSYTSKFGNRGKDKGKITRTIAIRRKKAGDKS